MEFPAYTEFNLPLLKALEDGDEHRLVDLHGKISDDLGLSAEQRSQPMPNKNQTYVYDMVSWASYRLKKAGLLSRAGPGIVKITRRGTTILKNPPSKITWKYLRDLESSPNATHVDPDQTKDDEIPVNAMRRAHKEVRDAVYSQLEDAVLTVSDNGFERLVLDLLEQMYGGKAEQTQRSRDGGIDGIVHKDRLGLGKIIVQAKKWTKQVDPRPVREFMGVLHGQDGVFITTSTFTPSARKSVPSNVILIDGTKLAELMWEYGVGVSKVENLEIKDLAVEYFDKFK